MLESVEFGYTPQQIIEGELAYPGLWNAIMTAIWQRRLVKEQVESEQKARS